MIDAEFIFPFFVSLALLAMGSYQFACNIRSYQTIRNMSTSKLQSASQGYVELSGYLQTSPKGALFSPPSKTQCVWWRYKKEKLISEKEDRWHTVANVSSKEPIMLNDETGTCFIYPDGATIIGAHLSEWMEKENDRLVESVVNYLKIGETFRYTEEYIFAGEIFYVLGKLETRNSREQKTTPEQIIEEWGKDDKALIQRFDRDNDGELNAKEWGLVKLAAQLEAEDRSRKNSVAPLENRIVKPDAGLPYILSADAEDDLIHELKKNTLYGVLMCGVGAIVLGYSIINYVL